MSPTGFTSEALRPEPPTTWPLVSIIVPHRNQTKWLAKCLESCLAQDYPAIEIIVVDDFSSESLDTHLALFAGRVRFHRLSSCVGPGEARNIGLNLAKGDIIQYLDADDYLAPRKLSLQVRQLLIEKADLALSRWRRVFELGFVQLHYAPEIPPASDRLLLETIADYRGWVPIMACLFRREFLAATGPWRSGDRNEDREFRLRALKIRPRIARVDECLFYYRRYPGASRALAGLFDKGDRIARLDSDIKFLEQATDAISSVAGSPESIGAAFVTLMSAQARRHCLLPASELVRLQAAFTKAQFALAARGADLQIPSLDPATYRRRFPYSLVRLGSRGLRKILSPYSYALFVLVYFAVLQWVVSWIEHVVTVRRRENVR